MQRKEFELIAATVKDTYDVAQERGGLVTRGHMAMSLATALQQTNSQFDAERFLRACGVAV